MKLAHHLSDIRPSQTIFIANKAARLKSEGYDIISLVLGEPDFDTPDPVKHAAIEAINQGKTKYTQVDGIIELKAAIQHKFRTENQLDYQLDQISVGAGSKQLIFNSLMATLDPGDEVIIPVPAWVSYAENVRMCQGVPILVPCLETNHFKMKPNDLESAITDRTKWLIFNSPCNPTGAVYSEDELKSLAEILLKYPDVMIMSDDIYEHLVYEPMKFKNILQVEPRLKKQTLVINGVSKAYAMTGWRLGYGACEDQNLLRTMAAIQSQSTVNASSISQWAAVSALTGDQSLLTERLSIFQQRRDFVTNEINHCPGLRCIMPDGAFYIYVQCQELIGKIKPTGESINSDVDLCDYLLDCGVSVVPGSAFDLSPYFRISYSTSIEQLTEACHRITKACSDLFC